MSTSKGLLTLVATPIGNLEDITFRAITALKEADVIACEDTRVTAKLLSAYGIDTPMLIYHEHNHREAFPKLERLMEEGKKIALVSDAGTPLISDPGSELVRVAREKNWQVTTTPGPSSVIAALTLSGLPARQFLFLGFLPEKLGERTAQWQRMKSLEITLLCFTPARELQRTLHEVQEILGNREVAVVREITKHFEESKRGNVAELIDFYAEPPRGEVVLVIAPATEVEGVSDVELSRLLVEALKHHSLKDAVQMVSQATQTPKKQVYALALQIHRS